MPLNRIQRKKIHFCHKNKTKVIFPYSLANKKKMSCKEQIKVEPLLEENKFVNSLKLIHIHIHIHFTHYTLYTTHFNTQGVPPKFKNLEKLL